MAVLTCNTALPFPDGIEWARFYAGLGWCPLPVNPPEFNNPKTGKAPALGNGWQEQINAQQNIERIQPHHNIGINLGASGDLVDVDLDCTEALMIAPHYLPPTHTFGRYSTPQAHWLYNCSGAKTKKFADPRAKQSGDKGMLVEVRATGQTVFPPSIHYTGERIAWTLDQGGQVPDFTNSLLAIDFDELQRLVGIVAAGSLLARHLVPGCFHDATLALAGALLRIWPIEEVKRFITVVGPVAGMDPPGVTDRLKSIEDTAAKLEADDAVSGWPILKTYLPDGVVEKLKEWLGIRQAPEPTWRRSPNPAHYQSQQTDGPPSQDEIALNFVQANQDRIRYCKPLGRWYKFTGKVWQHDSTGHVFEGIRDAVRKELEEMEAVNHLLTSGNVAGAERLAQNDQRIAITVDDLDQHPLLLNTHDGVVDLRTGELSPHHPDPLLSKITTCGVAAPGTPAPMWFRFLEQITRGDCELIQYLQRLAGYSLTGLATEHVLSFFYGGGRNGKGVFLNTVTKLMGDYAGTAPSDTFMASPLKGHPTELASLLGKRLVVAQEVSEGARWDEARIRMLTGGDRIAARYMRQDFFEFDPTHTLIIAGNHKPKMSTLDEAGLARMRVVPFTVTIPPEDRDPELEQKLKNEWGAILRWGVEGARVFLQQGLGTCRAVESATKEYVDSEDLTAQWIQEECTEDAQASTLLKALFPAWKLFAERGNHYVGSARKLSEELERLGYEKRRTRDGMSFVGLSLRSGPIPVGKRGTNFL